MDKHTCKQCGKKYNYCRSCMLKPIPWKAAGFCSKECSAAFKAPKIEIPKIEEVVEISTNEVVVEPTPKTKRKSKVKVEPEVEVLSEIVSDTETPIEEDGIHE